MDLTVDELEILSIINDSPDDTIECINKYYMKYKSSTDDQIVNLFKILKTFSQGDFEKNHTELFLVQIQKSDYHNMFADFIDYLGKTIKKNDLCIFLDLLLCETVNLTKAKKINKFIITKLIWEQKSFRNIIKYKSFDIGENDLSKGFMMSLFEKYEDNYDELLKAVHPLINDESIHKKLVDYFYTIINKNICYTQSNPDLNIIKKATPIYFLIFVNKFLQNIISKYSLQTIKQNILKDETSYSIKDYVFEDLPFFHKLLCTYLYGIKVAHIMCIKSFHNINLKLNDYSRMYGASNTVGFVSLKNQKDGLINMLKNDSVFVQNSYVTFNQIYKNIVCDDLIADSLVYIDIVCVYLKNLQFYDPIKDTTFEIVSNTIGGYGGFFKNIHHRFTATIIMFAYSRQRGYDIFPNIFNNLFKYISEVDFYKWCDIIVASDHQKKIVQTMLMLSDIHLEILEGSRDVIVGTLFNLLKRAVQTIDDFDVLCKKIKLKINMTEQIMYTLNDMIEIISSTLLFHGNVYSKKLISDVYPEVEEKYVVLIDEILKSMSNGKHTIYTVFCRPDLASLLMKCSYNSISAHIDFSTDHLLKIKNNIIDNLSYSGLDNEEKLRITNKLSVTNDDDLDYPSEFLDPLTCSVIKEPVKLPEIDDFFDKTSILMQIQHNGVNPYTRKPLDYDTLIKYNENPEISDQLKNFKNRLNDWILSNKK